MPRGDKSKYTDKQKRMAEHIEQGYVERGVSEDEAESRAWATVNKQTGGGNKSATLETGAVIQVPLFVNIGDRLKVQTETGTYMSRA